MPARKGVAFLAIFCISLSILAGDATERCWADPGSPVVQETITYRMGELATGNGYSILPETTVVHSGNHAIRFNWDFSQSAPGDNPVAWMAVRKRMVGHVEALRLWAYAEPRDAGSELKIWIDDVSGEVYATGVTIDWTGWKQVTFPIAPHPAWPSGDRNGVPDPPLLLDAITVDRYHGSNTGSVVIDDVEVITIAAPREGLLPSVECGANLQTFWGDPARLIAGVRNYSSTPASGLTYHVRLTDEYYGRTAWEGDILLATAPAHGGIHALQALNVPYGKYDVDWTLSDAQGPLQSGKTQFTRMLPACNMGISAAENAYLEKTSPWGGDFWQAKPEVASRIGARWERALTNWSEAEPKPGVYDYRKYINSIKNRAPNGITPITFTNFTAAPSVYQVDEAGFDRAVGNVNRGYAVVTTGTSNLFEIGNEENGPTKYLYTEAARNGAAAIRSANGRAVVANGGTAGIDIGWLRMQGDRGLYDWVDALCTHPYTTNQTSAEDFHIYKRTQDVVRYGDELGGMKHFWTTEFGWSSSDTSETDRADWIPREFLIGVAAGWEKMGLYSWDGDFGICGDGIPFPSAVSVHAMAKLLEGSRCAGLLQHDDNAWAVVWEKFGKPTLAAWVPKGTDDWTVFVGDAPVKVYDLFGNPLPADVSNGQLKLHLTTGPQYVTGASGALTQTAWAAALRDLQDRYGIHLNKTPLKDNATLAGIADAPQLDPAAIFAALKAATLATNAPKPDVSGLEANLLRMLVLEARMGRLSVTDPIMLRRTANFGNVAGNAIDSAHAADLDLPRLRWTLDEYQDLGLERAYAETSGDVAYANRLRSAQAVLATFATRNLMAKSEETFTAAWPYLYTLTQDGKLREHITLTPGIGVPVRVRVSNYAAHNYNAQVALQLPQGWKSDPAVRTVALKANKDAETSFHITCRPEAVGASPCILATLTIAGKPVCTVPFDDINIAPAVSVTALPVNGLLQNNPLHLILTNRDLTPLSGHLRLMIKGQTTAVARAPFKDIPPGQSQLVPIRLTGLRPGSDWPINAEVDLDDGRKSTQFFNIDFAAAVQASRPPRIDDDLSDWADALPLHIDRQEYTLGSYGNSWTPDNESANTWTKWDAQYLYFAAVVRDQIFNQKMHGGAIWTQDSIQIGIFPTADGGSYSEFALAKTPQGEEVYRYPSTDVSGGDVAGARLKVLLSHGQAIYEAAIPWAAIKGAQPAIGATMRYNVLLNDDDVTVPRRYMSRYGYAIVASKDVKDYGYLHLLGPNDALAPAGSATTDPNLIFKEDFAEYPDGGQPDAWLRLASGQPAPEGIVEAGAGRNGSKALVLNNTIGLKPNVFLAYVRALDNLDAGAHYVLHVWARAAGVVAESNNFICLCSDLSGHEGYIYPSGWKVTRQWQEFQMPFTAPASAYNLHIANEYPMDHLAIDEITIEKVP